MAKNHVQPGNIISVALAAAVVSGELLKVGDLAGVALASGDDGETISVAITEVFAVAKKPTDVMTAGQKVYLDPTNKRVTTSANNGASPPTAFIEAGKVIAAAGNGVATANLKLNA
jgi:predicted RecA/RadA family phage recombinase